MAETKRSIPAEGEEMIRVGHVYKEDSSDKEVIPFNVDFGSATVNFAPVASGQEDIMRTSDFLNRFKYQGLYSSRAENQKSTSESASRRVSRDAGTVRTTRDDERAR